MNNTDLELELRMVSDETRDRYERDLHRVKCAQSDLQESWLSMLREAYQRGEIDNAKSDAEGISADSRRAGR